MKISSKSLFHFTREYDTLLAILKSGGFWPKYCFETYKELKWWAAFTSFTDIPLANVSKHMDFYGDYGIGLSFDWKKKNNRIAPVLYLNPFSSSILKLTKSDIKATALMLSLYKKCAGKVPVNGENKIKHFMNEKEWRYIPARPNYKDAIIYGQKEQKYITEKNEETKELMAKFDITDIRYLFVSNEHERRKLLKDLDSIYSNAHDVDILKSRILTREQLNEDF